MVKGVCRQVIVVRQPEARMFEQAIFCCAKTRKTKTSVMNSCCGRPITPQINIWNLCAPKRPAATHLADSSDLDGQRCRCHGARVAALGTAVKNVRAEIPRPDVLF